MESEEITSVLFWMEPAFKKTIKAASKLAGHRGNMTAYVMELLRKDFKKKKLKV